MSKVENQLRYAKRLRLRGLCVRCGRKRNADRWMCDACVQKRNERRKLSNPVYCRECKKLIVSEERIRGRIFHKTCAEKRPAKKYPELHRAAALAYQQRHREKGLCQSCPRKVFKGGLCRRHYKIRRQWILEQQAS